MADKISKQELRAPDAFQKAGGEARDWLSGHQKLVVGIVALLVVIGAALGLSKYLKDRTERQAARALGEALETLGRPVEGEGQAAPDETPFKSLQEKQEAVRKSLADYRSEHSGTRAAGTAALPLAQAEYKLGNYDAALAAYGDYLEAAPKEDPLRASALEGQGYAHEAKGELDQAFAAFEQLAKDNRTDYLNGMGMYHQARVLIQQGKKEEAARRLSEIPTAAPDSAAARMAQERLATLTAEGVKVPAPEAATTAGSAADGG